MLAVNFEVSDYTGEYQAADEDELNSLKELYEVSGCISQ